VCCSGYVPRFNTFSCDASAVQHVPVACFHGAADTVVRTTCGQRAVAKLRESGLADVQWHSYDGMQHEACQEEIDDLISFISSKIPQL
jgi:predicted esterase